MKKNNDGYERIREAYAYAVSEQQLWFTRYQSCYKYAMPNRNNYWQAQSGQKKDNYLFDSTAVLAVRSFVAKTQDSITPTGQNWCTLKSGQMVADEDRDKLDKALQALTEVLFDNLRKSNFDIAAAESYFDLAAGTAALYVKETPGEDCPFWFESVSQYLICAFENSRGMLTNVFRQYKFIKYYQLQKMFPHVTFPKKILDAIKRSPYDTFPMVDAWLDNEDGTFCNYVGCENLSEIYFESESQDYSPWIVYRWAKLPGESYGRGPLMDVIGDVKTCNKMMERLIKQADLQVDPPYGYYNNSGFNPYNIRLEPGTLVPLGAMMGGGQKPLEPLFTPGNFQLGEWWFQEAWQNINKAMFANPIGQMNDPTKTATEIQFRQQLYGEEVGPALGRIQKEFLNVFTKISIKILIKQGKFPKDAFPNDTLASISYQSPLIQNQQSSTIRNIEQFVQAMDQIAGPQSAMSILNLGAAVQKLAELTNIPLEIVKNSGQITHMMQQQAQQQQQMQQAQMQQMQQQGSGGQQQGPNIPQGPSVLPGDPNAGQ